MKLFEFKIKVKKVKGLAVSGEHDVFVVASGMESALEVFYQEFQSEDVSIISVNESPCKVMVEKGIVK